jgi:membrane protease YdiL (CAAX protease family)
VTPVSARNVGAAALALQPFVALCALLLLVHQPTAAQLAVADPLVRALVMVSGPWGLPLSGAVAGALWWAVGRPDAAARRQALALAGMAVLVVLAGIGILRLGVGPLLPAFVPPEEGAAPGLLLGLGAGIVEESVFRFGVLAVLLLALPGRRAPLVAVVVTGLAFALAHELVPGAAAFSARYFLARFLFPGVVMSALCLRPGFAFAVTLHCGAHLLLPFAFR